MNLRWGGGERERECSRETGRRVLWEVGGVEEREREREGYRDR